MIVDTQVSNARSRLQSPGKVPFRVPERSYILCSLPRSGTFMFAGIMNDMHLGDPYEAFNPGANRRYRPYYDVGDFRELIRRVIEKQSSFETGVFGVKLFWDHLERFHQRVSRFEELEGLNLNKKEAIEVFFGSPKFIFLRRRDILKQAVSLARAAQSNHYQTIDNITDKIIEGKLVYDEDLISKTLMRNLSEIILWEGFFKEFDIKPLRLWYEDLIAEKDLFFAEVMSFIGETSEEVPGPRTKKLASGVNDDWCSRYLSNRSWLVTTNVDEIFTSGKHMDYLARLAFQQSNYDKKATSAIVLRIMRLFNAFRSGMGMGKFG